MSEDAGEYICNYMYYRALEACCNLRAKGINCTALFLHVPNFKNIDEDTQHQFLDSLILELAKSPFKNN